MVLHDRIFPTPVEHANDNTTETVRYQQELILTTTTDTHVMTPSDYRRHVPVGYTLLLQITIVHT